MRVQTTRSLWLAISFFIASQASSLGSPLFAGEITDRTTQQTPGITNDEIRIGSCCALTGPAKELGTQQLNGARAYINYINDQGGIHGRKIKLLTYDDGYDPTRAIEAFKQLQHDNCFAAAFLVGTPTAAKYVPMAELNHVPIVGLLTGAQLLHQPFRPHVFSVRASYFDETGALVDYMFTQNNNPAIGVIYQDDAFGAAVLSGVREAMVRHQKSPAVLGSFERNAGDTIQAIDHVRRAHPDVVFLAGTYGSVSQIVKQSHDMGWHPKFVTVSFVGTEAFIQNAGKDADGTIISQVVPSYNQNDLRTVALYRKLLKKYFPTEKPCFASLEGFIDALVLSDALKISGPQPTRENFIAALETMTDTDVGLGNLRLKYGRDCHKGFNLINLTVVRDGQPMPLDGRPRAAAGAGKNLPGKNI